MLALPARGFWAVRAERRSSPGDQVSRSGPGEEPGAPGWGGGGGRGLREREPEHLQQRSGPRPAAAGPTPPRAGGAERRWSGPRPPAEGGSLLAAARRGRCRRLGGSGTAGAGRLRAGGWGGGGAALGPARPPPPFVPSPRRRRWSRRAPSLLFRWGSPSCRDSAPALPPAAERDPARAKGASRRSAAAGR